MDGTKVVRKVALTAASLAILTAARTVNYLVDTTDQHSVVWWDEGKAVLLVEQTVQQKAG